MKRPADYLTHHMEPYEAFGRTSALSIEVLSFLNGRPWDWVALAYVHALRPSSIRVTEGGVTCDSRRWRVTVYLKEGTRLINRITQEVEVGLPEGVAHGSALNAALKYGIDSAEVRRWL